MYLNGWEIASLVLMVGISAVVNYRSGKKVGGNMMLTALHHFSVVKVTNDKIHPGSKSFDLVKGLATDK
jgi:hypothetical protein